jgi:hypothetical protein
MLRRFFGSPALSWISPLQHFLAQKIQSEEAGIQLMTWKVLLLTAAPA